MKEKPPISRVLNTREMEEVAKKVLSYKAWAYYSSAGDDEISTCIFFLYWYSH